MAILNLLAGALAGVKDKATEVFVKAFLNQKIEKLGKVAELQIDSEHKTICVQLALKGETSLIAVNVDAYELIQENGQAYISFQSFRASREWIENLLREYVAGRRFPVSEAARRAL
jgi:hypothetical protein